MLSIRHRTTRLALTAAAALGTALIPAAAASAKVHCQPSGSHTLVSSSYARVYGKGTSAYVCIKSSGKTTKLTGADPSSDRFALGGHYVGWSSSDPTDPSVPPHSIVTVMRISDRSIDGYWYPFQTNETIDRIVVASDGAAAWSMTPNDGSFTQVQGTDRLHHPADQFSDDHADVKGSSLKISGKTVSWRYVDGTSGSQNLF
jgi:hypothetical protein